MSVISAPSSVIELVNMAVFARQNRDLFNRGSGERSLMQRIFKTQDPSIQGRQSLQGADFGTRPHPFDFRQLLLFANSNEYHATCLHTKVAATVGLGFKQDASQTKRGTAAPGTVSIAPPETPLNGMRLLSKVDEILDPLCRISFADDLEACCLDYWTSGNGWLEVKRVGDEIVGIYQIPAHTVLIHTEDNLGNMHYEIANEYSSLDKRFCRFGEKAEFMARRGVPASEADNISEVIHLRCPTNQDRYYGWPHWLSAVPKMELFDCLTQHKYDFFLNRGVPEFMLFILGQKLSKEDWAKVESSLRANIGSGNSHKSFALNLENQEIKIQLEKLVVDSKGEETYNVLSEPLALSVVTAHSVPPLLAGILIPGKLGAANELPNAMRAFQALVIGKAQRVFQRILGSTLGSDKAGLGLQTSDFEFFTILDEINVSEMDTVARMRESLPEAQAKGRDLGAGVKS